MKKLIAFVPIVVFALAACNAPVLPAPPVPEDYNYESQGVTSVSALDQQDSQDYASTSEANREQ